MVSIFQVGLRTGPHSESQTRRHGRWRRVETGAVAANAAPLVPLRLHHFEWFAQKK